MLAIMSNVAMAALEPNIKSALQVLRNPKLTEPERVEATKHLVDDLNGLPSIRAELVKLAKLARPNENEDERSIPINARKELILITQALGRSTNPAVFELLGPLLMEPNIPISTGRDNYIGSPPEAATSALGAFKVLGGKSDGPESVMVVDWKGWWQQLPPSPEAMLMTQQLAKKGAVVEPEVVVPAAVSQPVVSTKTPNMARTHITIFIMLLVSGVGGFCAALYWKKRHRQ